MKSQVPGATSRRRLKNDDAFNTSTVSDNPSFTLPSSLGSETEGKFADAGAVDIVTVRWAMSPHNEKRGAEAEKNRGNRNASDIFAPTDRSIVSLELRLPDERTSLNITELDSPLMIDVPVGGAAYLAAELAARTADGANITVKGATTSSPECIFWDDGRHYGTPRGGSQWSRAGCSVVAVVNATEKNGTRYVRCACSHMTTFAVALMATFKRAGSLGKTNIFDAFKGEKAVYSYVMMIFMASVMLLFLVSAVTTFFRNRTRKKQM